MAPGRLKKFLAAEWSFLGVVVFFITHGYSRNLLLVPLPALLLLMAILLASAAIVFFISKWLLKSSTKASLVTSFVCFIILFFGVYQEFIDSFEVTSQLAKLRVLVPVSLLAIVVVFILLKRTKVQFRRVFIYLNVLVMIYIVIDLAVIAYGVADRLEGRQKVANQFGFKNCDTCSKPPVYLIILDGYFSSDGMRKYFNYDNAAFDNFLRQENFHINQNSYSNYLHTLFSMTSMFHMDYLGRDLGAIDYSNHHAFTLALENLMGNKACAFFVSQGYTIRNFSLFDMKDGPAASSSGLWPDRIHLITRQTMFYQVEKYLPGLLLRNRLISPGKNETDLANSIDDLMKKALPQTKDNSTPTFTYLHLLMPHAPYIFDSTGKKWSEKITAPGAPKYTTDEQFLQYQVYVNKKITAYISLLKTMTEGKAIIMLMSDHGYPHAWIKDKKFPYSNLNAVYLPNGNYSGWYDSITNVNQFRVLFNTQFGQKMPILPDSPGVDNYYAKLVWKNDSLVSQE